MRSLSQGFRKKHIARKKHKTPQRQGTTGSDRATGGNPVRGAVLPVALPRSARNGGRGGRRGTAAAANG